MMGIIINDRIQGLIRPHALRCCKMTGLPGPPENPSSLQSEKHCAISQMIMRGHSPPRIGGDER